MKKNSKKHQADQALAEVMFLFNEGKNFQSYKLLGAHKTENGCDFAVWAPNAVAVSVVCDRNNWNRDKNKMQLNGQTGIWTLSVEGIEVGELYKYSIETQRGEVLFKADPFAFESQLRPETASVVADIDYEWTDRKWLEKREATPPYNQPINIYELHFGSWKNHSDGSFYSYTETADELIPYIKKMGYTHIELMPICEYPYDGSWGYQVCGYFSATSRYGSGAQLKEFVDKCHKAGIGVIMDWVPAHFPKDAHGLARFDGSCLFEHPDTRLGEHKEWGTLIFDWQKYEVHSFLISNAIFWLEEYHMDGLRVDAVSSMLYLDYNRRDGEWLPNKHGGKENLAAIDFLKKLNTEVFKRFPNVMMIAEESTAWEGVTRPVCDGGLGFNFKWNMGWMNDTLRFMMMDPYFRGANHNMLTFSMMYAYSENFILPLSHDEVVHGKGSLINKMYGGYEQKFKSLKLLYAYMYAHPGKKLNFMGNEIAQFDEWDFEESVDWRLLDYESHRQFQTFTEQLNKFYKANKAMYEDDYDWRGFRWIEVEDRVRSVISFERSSRSGRSRIIVVANFAAQAHKRYEVAVPGRGDYEIVFSTEAAEFGGAGLKKCRLTAKEQRKGEKDYKITIDLPELSAFYIRKTTKTKQKKVDI